MHHVKFICYSIGNVNNLRKKINGVRGLGKNPLRGFCRGAEPSSFA
jgi:hypothetical protein